MQQTLSNLQVSYTYHIHEGSAGTTANGCYTKKATQLCQVTSSSTGEVRLSNAGDGYFGYDSIIGTRCPGDKHWHLTRITYVHSVCGSNTIIDNIRCTGDGSGCPHTHVFTKSVGNGTKAHNVETDNYIIGCGKNEGDIESVTIKY